MDISKVFNLEDLVTYLVENGLNDEEANHLIHQRFQTLENKTLAQLVRYGEWYNIRSFAERYMLGESLK